MSTLSLRKIKHDSASVDNITLDSNGNLTVAGTIAQSKAMTTQYDGIGIRMGSSTANTNRGATFLQHTYVDAGGNQGNYVYNHSLRQNDGTYIANVYTADYSAGVHSWYHPNGGLSGNPVMQIDAAGRVTKPYQPAFRAYHNNTITWNSGALAPVVYNTTVFNIGNHYNPSTGIFTAPVAGRYVFTVFEMFMDEPTYTFIFAAVHVNGSTSTEFMRQGTKSNYDTFGGTVLLSLSANDQVRIVVGTAGVDAGYLRSGVEMNSFMGYLVG